MESVDPRSFDVFISYKNSDAQGDLTQDAKLAFALHDALEEHGIKAFCSTLSLTRMGQSAYKDAINQALDAARIMVVVGTNIDNILSPWVKYEWGSFHDDLLTGRKTTGTLVSYISGMNPNELPRELRSYESFPLEQGGDVRIVEFIQACMENRVELGYAGTATGKRKLAVLKAGAGHGLINAQDPDEIEGKAAGAGDGADAGANAGKGKGPKGSKGKTPFIAAGIAAVLVLGLAGGYYAHSQQEAAVQAQAQEQAAQEAAQQAKEQAAQEQAAKEKAEQEALEYEQTHTSYTVKYLVKGTSKGAKGFPKTVKKSDVEVGSTISVKVPSIDGYTLSSVDGAKLNSKKTKASLTVIKKDGGNIIKMLYVKNAEPSTPSYTPSTNSGSTSGGNGGSSGGSNGGSTNSGGGSKNSGGSSNKVPKGWIVD